MAGETFTHGCCTDRACSPGSCMSLPEGESCGTCVHKDRCCAVFGAKPENTWCDFFPRRFVKREEVARA